MLSSFASRVAAVIVSVVLAATTLTVVAAPASAATSGATPGNLAVESVPRATGVDTQSPRLSWTVDSGPTGFSAGATQTAAEVALVGSSPAWSKTLSGSATSVTYDGSALTANKRYEWTVRVQDSTGAWSQRAQSWFVTGPLSEAGWAGAAWIGATTDDNSSPQFRADFTVKSGVAVAAASLTVAGVGRNQAYLNGAPVNARVLDAAAVDYSDRIPYVTHALDVSRLSAGTNTVGVVLANGWYRTSQSDGWATQNAPWRAPKALRAVLTIDYADGTRDQLVTKAGATGNPWRVTPSETTWTGEYGGETVDLRAVQAGWNAPGFSAASWSAPVAVTAPVAPLKAQVMPGVQRLAAEPQVSAPAKVGDSYVYTLVNNITGWAKITLSGSAGQTIQVDYDETLGADGLVSKYMNYKVADTPRRWQHDEFILQAGTNVLEPRFTYKGFKYLQLTGPAGWTPPAASDIVIYPLATAMADSGSFSSSDPLLTWLHKANTRTLLNNIQGVQTDCPQREKMGWLADLHLSDENTLSNFDAAAFLEKTLADIRDGQVKSGTYAGFVPDFVPTPGVFSNDSFDDPWWSGAIVNIAWDLYRYRGDPTVLSDNYQAMKNWMTYLGNDLTPNGVPEGELGDWLAVAGTSNAFTSTALWYFNARQMADIATILGKTADAATYTQLTNSVRNLAISKFFNADGTVKESTQTAISLALVLGMHPVGAKDALAAQLVARVTADAGTVTTGIVGTRYLFQALDLIDRNDLAYAIVSNPTRGFTDMKNKGATTIWEAWDPTGLSQNHPALTSVEGWMYQAVGGIHIDQYGTNPGIRIAPTPVGGSTTGSATLRIAPGTVSSGWTLSGNALTLTTNTPLGVRADVALPYAAGATVRMDGAIVSSSTVGTRAVVANVPSGPHTFTVTIALPAEPMFPLVTSSSSVEAYGWGRALVVDGVTTSTGASQGFHSAEGATSATQTEWLQLDLRSSRAVNQVTLWPSHPDGVAVGDDAWGFPVDYRIDVSNDATFATYTTLASRTGLANPKSVPQTSTGSATGRYVRITATRLGLTRPNAWAFSLAEVVVNGAPPTPAQPKASASGDLSFGNVPVGMQSAVRTLTITNTGDAPLRFTGISGTNGAVFKRAAGSTCFWNTALAPGGSCVIPVTATPAAAGSVSDIVEATFLDGVPDLRVTESVTGVTAGPQVTVTGDLAFGSVPIGTTTTKTITITNNGPTVARFQGVDRGGAPFASASGSTCAWNTELAAGQSCVWVVKATPTTTGLQTKNFELTFWDDLPTINVPETVTGVQ